MNQVPFVPTMNPYMVQPQTAYVPSAQQPRYNAVNIEINNPTAGAQGVGQAYQPQYAQPTLPLYNYPQAPVYTYPQAQAQQPAYYPPYICQPVPQQVPQIPAVPQAPTVAPVPVAQEPAPAPQVVPVPVPQVVPAQTNVNVPPVPPVEVTPEVPTTPEPAIAVAPEVKPEAKTEVKPEAKPEVIPSETITPQVDLNSFIAKLNNPDFDVQSAGMEEIANMIKTAPDKATELVDTKVFDALTNIINFDSSALEGPTAEQVAAREKIMAGKENELSDAEKTLANTITPKEQAERNKSYALFTAAMMQKLYGSEVARLSNQVVPLTELPGVVTVVDALKDNPNPMVRASAIESLSHIQAPEYKKDLTTVFTIAQNDQDPGVAETAKAALDKLNQI